MIPWLIHEAEISLYPAWRDGMPYRGPGPRGAVPPVLSCHAALSITETKLKAAPTGFATATADPARDAEWDLSVSFPDGLFSDAYSFVSGRLPDSGLFILVVRFVDPRTRCWTLLRFFYVTPQSDETGDSGETMNRTLRLKAGHLQETHGATAIPAMAPTVLGELDWVCGPQRVTAMLFDPATETWTSTAMNETGDTHRYVNLANLTANDVRLTGYFPLLQNQTRPAGMLPRKEIVWTMVDLLTIGNHLSAILHGYNLHGLAIQQNGSPEPLLSSVQSREIDAPLLVFRYLRRIYATIGHGVIATPKWIDNFSPPTTHDPYFRIAAGTVLNPVSGLNGLVLLPTAAYAESTPIVGE